MTLNALASKLAKLEGKKSQARIGDIRELIKLLVQMDAEGDGDSESPLFALIQASATLAKKLKDKANKKAVKSK